MFQSVFRLTCILLLGVGVASCVAAPEEEDALDTNAEELVWPRRSLRIAVVGAGPSGLTAAQTLRDLGYRNVTVFEREDRVGGKVHSLRAGGRVTELGAVFASPDYHHVLGLADRYGIPYEEYQTDRGILDQDVVHSAESFLASRYSQLELIGALVAYAGVQARFAQLNLSGFAYLPDELDLPFDEFAARNGITPIAELVRSVMVGFGYSYYEDAPAMYFLKLIPWLVKLGGERGLQQAPYYTFPTGYQSIWEAVASELDVRLNSEVTSITRRSSRRGAPIEITINGTRRYEFDEVIVSVALNRVGDFMPLTDEEDELFSQVESERYFFSAFTAQDLPRESVLFFHDHAFPDTIDHVNVWASRDQSPLMVAYQIADWSSSYADITATLAADVASRGGRFGALQLRQEWDYFPHVSTEALRGGFYERVESLQGENHTYYVGSTLSFETVEHSARYARDLVIRHFPPAFL
ncbi:flavin monoamine oxidase family protein [Sandaracinus amylolyticus]|uniref:Tryptophan 2-monooxygenase n=1 Tax=Sandaracinus amylolyticus TaxID=927083 RepID=A0A0F6SHU5_9BACT|nr:FAD-dependent oxidoreductase [Sandaracinus amylolyticus]AKF11054.1 Protoporphyrinogen oxidase [Sandaracinus amylolyticus]